MKKKKNKVIKNIILFDKFKYKKQDSTVHYNIKLSFNKFEVEDIIQHVFSFKRIIEIPYPSKIRDNTSIKNSPPINQIYTHIM